MATNESWVQLFTTEGLPLRFDTQWGDIHEESKKVLLSLEERILEYREESEKLEQCADLYKSEIYEENFKQVAACATQELGEINATITRNGASLEALQIVKTIMHNTEIVVGSFKRLAASIYAAEESTSVTDGTKGQYKSPEEGKVEFYSGLPNKPSPFLQQTVIRLEQQLEEYRQQVRKLDHLLCENSERIGSSQTQGSFLDSLHTTMQNSHDFFMHVAAQVELLHQQVEGMKESYLANLRRRGISKNPFLEADRREDTKRETEARRVHPTLHTLNASSDSGTLFISQQMHQNGVVYGPCGSTSSVLVGAQPIVGLSPVSMPQVDGYPVASNQLRNPPPLQIPNDNVGAGDLAPSGKRAKGKHTRKRA